MSQLVTATAAGCYNTLSQELTCWALIGAAPGPARTNQSGWRAWKVRPRTANQESAIRISSDPRWLIYIKLTKQHASHLSISSPVLYEARQVRCQRKLWITFERLSTSWHTEQHFKCICEPVQRSSEGVVQLQKVNNVKMTQLCWHCSLMLLCCVHALTPLHGFSILRQRYRGKLSDSCAAQNKQTNKETHKHTGREMKASPEPELWKKETLRQYFR